MVKCKVCGEMLEEEIVFCPSCGASVEMEEKDSIQNYYRKSKLQKFKWLIPIIIVAVVAMIIVLVRKYEIRTPFDKLTVDMDYDDFVEIFGEPDRVDDNDYRYVTYWYDDYKFMDLLGSLGLEKSDGKLHVKWVCNLYENGTTYDDVEYTIEKIEERWDKEYDGRREDQGRNNYSWYDGSKSNSENCVRFVQVGGQKTLVLGAHIK
jgi:hypothetical protein